MDRSTLASPSEANRNQRLLTRDLLNSDKLKLE